MENIELKKLLIQPGIKNIVSRNGFLGFSGGMILMKMDYILMENLKVWMKQLKAYNLVLVGVNQLRK